MNCSLRIFCLDRRVIYQRDISEFLIRGAHFEVPPVFIPDHNSQESITGDWKSLVIKYHPGHLPLIITRSEGGEAFREQIDELLLDVSACSASTLQREVVKHLRHVSQVFSIDVNPGLPEKCWTMLDDLERHLARNLDGIIYAPAEGFFDRDLQHIFLFQTNDPSVPDALM